MKNHKRQRPSKQVAKPPLPPPQLKLIQPLAQLKAYAEQQEGNVRKEGKERLSQAQALLAPSQTLVERRHEVSQCLNEADRAYAKASVYAEMQKVIDTINSVNSIKCSAYEHKGARIGAIVTHANGTTERCHEYRSLYMNRMEAEHRLLCRLGLAQDHEE